MFDTTAEPSSVSVPTPAQETPNDDGSSPTKRNITSEACLDLSGNYFGSGTVVEITQTGCKGVIEGVFHSGPFTVSGSVITDSDGLDGDIDVDSGPPYVISWQNGRTWTPSSQDMAVSFNRQALIDVLAGKSAEEYLQEAEDGGHLDFSINAKCNGCNCSSIDLYSSFDLTSFADGTFLLPTGSAAPSPWCRSHGCVTGGGTLAAHCNLTEFALRVPVERRGLAGDEGPKAVMEMGSFFEDIRVATKKSSWQPSRRRSPKPTPVPWTRPTPSPTPNSAASVDKLKAAHAVGTLLGIMAWAFEAL